MIGSSHRFHGHNSLRFVYQNGQTVRGALISLKYAANPARKSYRAAVVVSRKVHKSAVVRNRLRRRVYEAVRRNEPQFKTAADLAFTIYSDSLLELSGAELQKQVDSLLKRAGVLSGRPSAASQTGQSATHAIVKPKEKERIKK